MSKKTKNAPVRAAQAVVPQELKDKLTDTEIKALAEDVLNKTEAETKVDGKPVVKTLEQQAQRDMLINTIVEALRQTAEPAALVSPKNGQVYKQRSQQPIVPIKPRVVDTNVPPKKGDPPYRIFVRELVSGEPAAPTYTLKEVLQWWDADKLQWQDVPVFDPSRL